MRRIGHRKGISMPPHRALLAIALSAAGAFSWLFLWRPQHKAQDQAKAKQAPLTPEVAQEVEGLVRAYHRMAEDFATQGLDGAAIKTMQPWFHGLGADEVVWPKRYDQMETPFPPDSVRLLVVPLESCPSVASLAAAAAARIAALLPEGVKVFANARTQYHITVFHSSHPVDTRPDPFQPNGGMSVDQAPHLRSNVTQEVLERESLTVRQVVATHEAPELEAQSILMTRPGTLLLTWVDKSGRITGLRKHLKTTFPGATSKQSNIIHTSLFRIVAPETLDMSIVQAIDNECAQLTQAIRGRRCVPDNLWWIRESEFSTVVGHREVFPYNNA